jgi:hypothetical protein
LTALFGRGLHVMVIPEKDVERDWTGVITALEKSANIKMKIITAVLADEAADLDMVPDLHRDVEAKAKRFDALFLKMLDELGPDHPLIHSALAVEDMWGRMSVTLLDRVTTMRGLTPIGSL